MSLQTFLPGPTPNAVRTPSGQTTGYDSMKIPRVKGRRREVRRMLAQQSKELLGACRRGDAMRPGCPLAKAIENIFSSARRA